MRRNIISFIILLNLLLVAAISGNAQPTWQVDPSNYVYSMTITGKVTTDGYFSTDINDKVAAFVNGECRGITNVKYVSTIDGYFVFLMVYSNDPSGTVTFKIWDNSENKEITAKETINFTVNDIIGSVNNPYIFSASNLSNQANILSFSLPGQIGGTMITGNNINVLMHWSSNISNAIATFTLSDGAKAYVGGVQQTSGVSANNFSVPTTYTIVSADNTNTITYKVTVTIDNDIPTDILLSANSKQENSTSLYIGDFTTITANPNEKHVYSLVGAAGAENDNFTINGNALFAKKSFNYEEKQSYKIYVRADDQKGGIVQKYFTIAIQDINEAPTNLVMLNLKTLVTMPPNSVIATLKAVDEDITDSHTYNLAFGNGTNDKDNDLFFVEGDLLKNKNQMDFGPATEFRILVRATDKGHLYIQAPLVINTQNQGQPPLSISLSNTVVLGTSNPPLFVGKLSTLDEDQVNGHNYSFSADSILGPDNPLFRIQDDLLFLDSPEPVASRNLYTVKIMSADSMGNTITKSFTITVKEKLGNENFFLTKTGIAENFPYNTIVGYFDSETYRSSEYTFSLPLEVDLNIYGNNDFKLVGRTLLTNKVFDFEEKNQYLLLVEITDGVTRVQQDVILNIINQNDAPSEVMLSNQYASEKAVVNSIIGTFSAVDQDKTDTHVFNLIIGNGINDEGNSHFRIEGNNLILAKPLDFEKKDAYNILVRATDSRGASFEKGIRILVVDANDAPVFTTTPVNYVVQDQVYVYAFNAIDSEEDAISYRFENLPLWLTFYQQSNLLSGIPGNDQVGTFTFTIIASDSKENSSQQVNLTVINKNDAPQINSYIENITFYTGRNNTAELPKQCMTDPDAGDILAFSIASANNSALPSWITFNASTLTISGNPPVNALGVYELKLTARDKGNLKEWILFDLKVELPASNPLSNKSETCSIYPNPASSTLFIRLTEGVKQPTLYLADLTGKIISTAILEEKTANELSISHLQQGMYIVTIVDEGKIMLREKLTKQ